MKIGQEKPLEKSIDKAQQEQGTNLLADPTTEKDKRVGLAG
jgi:hypothetical protein